MNDPEIFDTLMAMPLFQNLDGPTLERIIQHLELRTYPPGEVIFREGDGADAFYVVHKGAVWVSKGDGQGPAQGVVVLGKGAHFGEQGILLEAPRTATVTTGEPTELLVLTIAAADKVLLDAPYAAAMFFRSLAVALSDRLRSTTDEYTWLKQSLQS
jgi:CRP/FNR family cyclic AMP-dependent transcriptional regulator